MTGRESTISVRFAGTVGNFGVDVGFETPMRGVTALYGPSGAGKTTLLRCIAGLEHLDGDLIVGGEVWQSAGGVFRPPHRRRVGYVFQESSLFSHLSVEGNLLYGSRRAGSATTARIDEIVELMGIGTLLERDTSALSGGERQRVAIGRALLSEPGLLLMDEPLAGLDRGSRDEILPYLETLREGLSVPMLYVSHDLGEVQRLADTLVLLEKGRVLASGPLETILADTRLPVARSAEASVVVEATVKSFDDRYNLTAMDVGGEVLWIPGWVGEAGHPRRVRIAAADVSLATERPSRTSILNVLEACVSEIAPLDAAQMTVVLSIGPTPTMTNLLARISRRAQETLGLVPGQHVWAQVKAVSLVAAQGSANALRVRRSTGDPSASLH